MVDRFTDLDGNLVDDVAAKVLRICRRLLENEAFGLDDNFFEWGGHSLMAMTLVLELESQLRLKVGLEKVFKAPTVRELCASLQETDHDGPTAILPVKRAEAGKMLYFIHGAFEFSPLCETLSPEIAASLVTINDRKWLQQLMAANDILMALDRICDAYADAIASAQQGAFYLAGHSFGGLCAIETACQLEKRGVLPDFVFLFDTYLHSSRHRVIYDVLHNGSGFRKVRELLSQNVRGEAARVPGPWNRPSQRVTDKTHDLDTITETEFGAMLRSFRERASDAYRGPKRAPACRTVLFRATERMDGQSRRIDPDLGWARHLEPNLSIVPVPGNHFTMIKPESVTHIGDEINRLICSPKNVNQVPATHRP